jgi:fatty acid desaturase
MQVTASVERARTKRRERRRSETATMLAVLAACIGSVSWLQWELLKPWPWFGRAAVLAVCWVSAGLVVAAAMMRRFSDKS